MTWIITEFSFFGELAYQDSVHLISSLLGNKHKKLIVHLFITVFKLCFLLFFFTVNEESSYFFLVFSLK